MERFEPNWRGIRSIITDSSLYDALERRAAPIEARWKSQAGAHVRTGEYLRSIHRQRSRGLDRVRVRVIAEDDKAAILEARYHFGGRAAG